MIDIGICSYKSAERLKRVIDSIHKTTVEDFRILIWHNQSPGDYECIKTVQDQTKQHVISENLGYAGAVNGLIAMSTSDRFVYCDNDIEIRTRWDQKFSEVLDKFPKVAQVFPGAGHYGFHNGEYRECLWNAGYFWMLRHDEPFRRKLSDSDHWHRRIHQTFDKTYPFDSQIGHHEEVDFMIRLRLAGFRIACCPDVDVWHEANSTAENPDNHKPGGRIHDGVVRWMNKWNRYFCGEELEYAMDRYDPRALRYTDWPPCALYLERWTLAQFPMNRDPRVVQTSAGPMDAIEILKPTECYRGRAI